MEPSRQAEMMQLFGEYRAEQDALGKLDSETKRNTDNIDLFEAMIRDVWADVTMIIAGHHIMVMRANTALPIEIASADTLIFDHGIARTIWPETWQEVLTRLALEPTATRDALLRELYSR